MRRRGLLIGASSLPFAAPLTAAAAVAGISVQIHFECLWWSEPEMVGINPDRPPPKTTRVRIARWEYSDPIGVPHPDEVILVAILTARTARAISLALRPSWRIRGWADAPVIAGPRLMLEAGAPARAEIVIPVAHMILEREARGLRGVLLGDGRELAPFSLAIQRGD